MEEFMLLLLVGAVMLALVGMPEALDDLNLDCYGCVEAVDPEEEY